MMGKTPLIILNLANTVQSHSLGVYSHRIVALLSMGLVAINRQAGMQITSRF